MRACARPRACALARSLARLCGRVCTRLFRLRRSHVCVCVCARARACVCVTARLGYSYRNKPLYGLLIMPYGSMFYGRIMSTRPFPCAILLYSYDREREREGGGWRRGGREECAARVPSASGFSGKRFQRLSKIAISATRATRPASL
jgi:hypothetical protein